MAHRRFVLIAVLCLLPTGGPLTGAAEDRASATVVVKVPDDGKLYFNGGLTKQTGTTRTFSTPDLQQGKSYVYEVKAEVIRNGKPVTKTKEITLRASETTQVDFSDLETAPSDSGKEVKEEKPKPVRTWQYDAGDGKMSTIAGADGGDWIERDMTGQRSTTFTFVRRTNRFTELYDKHREFTLILYWDGQSEWSVGKGWNMWLKGKWLEEKEGAGCLGRARAPRAAANEVGRQSDVRSRRDTSGRQSNSGPVGANQVLQPTGTATVVSLT
jgi:uncharacterized protein (TIGR03000 family)